jgi:hypothetical protein
MPPIQTKLERILLKCPSTHCPGQRQEGVPRIGFFGPVAGKAPDPRALAMLLLTDEPQETPALPARYYRQKAAEARRAAEEATTRAIKERLHGSAAISISWPMPLTEPGTQQTRPRG